MNAQVITVHPYRVAPPPPEPSAPEGMPSEERFLIGLFIVIGGVRIFTAILTGSPLDAEPTLGLAMFVGGLWWGLRSYRLRPRRRRPRSGNLHDATASDRALDA